MAKHLLLNSWCVVVSVEGETSERAPQGGRWRSEARDLGGDGCCWLARGQRSWNAPRAPSRRGTRFWKMWHGRRLQRDRSAAANARRRQHHISRRAVGRSSPASREEAARLAARRGTTSGSAGSIPNVIAAPPRARGAGSITPHAARAANQSNARRGLGSGGTRRHARFRVGGARV